MDTKIRPSAIWYVVAAGLLGVTVIGVMLLGLGIVSDVAGLFDLTIHEGGGEFEVAIEKAGSHTIYVQVDRVRPHGVQEDDAQEHPAQDLDFSVVRADGPLAGTAFELDAPENTHLTIHDHGYIPLRSFVAEPDVKVVVTPLRPAGWEGRDLTLAVGRTFSVKQVAGTAGRIGGIIALLVLGGGGALAVFFVTLARRMGSKRRIEAEVAQRLMEERRRPEAGR